MPANIKEGSIDTLAYTTNPKSTLVNHKKIWAIPLLAQPLSKTNPDKSDGKQILTPLKEDSYNTLSHNNGMPIDTESTALTLQSSSNFNINLSSS